MINFALKLPPSPDGYPETSNSPLPLRPGCGFVLAGIANFTLIYFLQRIAPRGREDGNQWLFAIPALLAAIVTGVIAGWVIDWTARTTAAFAAAFVTSPFITMSLMPMLRTIPGVNKEAPGLPFVVATVLVMPAVTFQGAHEAAIQYFAARRPSLPPPAPRLAWSR